MPRSLRPMLGQKVTTALPHRVCSPAAEADGGTDTPSACAQGCSEGRADCCGPREGKPHGMEGGAVGREQASQRDDPGPVLKDDPKVRKG